VILQGQPQSRDYTFSAYEIDSNLEEKPLVEDLRLQLNANQKWFQGNIGLMTGGGKRKLPKSEVLIRKVELSFLKAPKN
jgi:hypothetical protein